MAGAVVGAHAGTASVPDRIARRLATANPGLDLGPLAAALLALRGHADG
jgi:hypothetical protein